VGEGDDEVAAALGEETVASDSSFVSPANMAAKIGCRSGRGGIPRTAFLTAPVDVTDSG
jgi:hypothetical protein